jgi:hypothetical protein
MVTYNEIKKMYELAGHRFFKGPYNVNLWAIRNPSLQVNEWNDLLGVAYQDAWGNEINLVHSGTTKPGLYWLKNKLGNINGTFILMPGQYLSCFMLGKHGKYDALVQNGMPFKGWRDNDKDGEFDFSGPIYTDVRGLNMHTESLLNETEKVGAYSAGCMVREFDREHFMVMELLKRSAEIYGDTFSFALF